MHLIFILIENMIWIYVNVIAIYILNSVSKYSSKFSLYFHMFKFNLKLFLSRKIKRKVKIKYFYPKHFMAEEEPMTFYQTRDLKCCESMPMSVVTYWIFCWVWFSVNERVAVLVVIFSLMWILFISPMGRA